MAYGGGSGGSSGGYGSGGSGYQTITGVPVDDDDDEGGGIIGILDRALHSSAANVRDIALSAPGGIKQMHLALAAADPSNPRHFGHSDTKALKELGKQSVISAAQDIRHPLRNPVYTVLTVLPFLSAGTSTALRTTAVAGRGAEVSRARAFLTNPATSRERVITTPSGQTAKGHYSRSGIGIGTQLVTDKALQAAAKRGAAKGQGKKGTGGRAERFLEGRADKWINRETRVQAAVDNANVNKLAAATAKITPVESRALRFAFEKIPVPERLNADIQRVQEASGRVGNVPGADWRTVKRLEDREQWGRDALQHLALDENGIPTLRRDTPEGERLGRMLDLMEKVYGDRETILKALNIMDEAALDAAKHRTGRFVLGAHWVRPTPARIGRSPAVVAARKRSESLSRRFEKLYEQEQPGSIVTKNRKLNREQAEQYLAELNLVHDNALKNIADAQFGPVDKREVSRRNVKRGKAKRQAKRTNKSLTMRGFGSTNLKLEPTVWDERFAEAQRMINEQIERNPDHPVMKRWAERQDEIARLEDALSPDPDEVFGTGPTKRKPVEVAEERLKGTSARLERLGSAAGMAKEDLARAEARAQRYLMETGIVGPGEGLELPEGAGHIGYQRQAKVFAPQVKTSSTGTLGHSREPTLTASKGEAIRYGLDEPNVGKILASRGRYANKLKTLARRVEIAREGGTAFPTRKDDVFLWNDDQILSQEKLPSDVRDYLNEPEKFEVEGKSADEANNIIDQARATWMRWSDNWDDWNGLDDEAKAALQAAAEGKGVFVHRKVLGDLGRPLPGKLPFPKVVKAADAVNNIQKSLLIYLKANYITVQALSNTAMNFIQQGPAAPINIARAGKLMHDDPELAEMIGDIMGSGAVMQAAFEGTGKTALATQKLAHWMSRYVDGPARLSAWVSEAEKMGYKTPAQKRALIEDPDNLDDLVQVSQRGKEAIVDYGEMSDAERNFIRRMFFVYPWLKGSTKWSGHFVRDHPLQASVLGKLGITAAEMTAEERPEGPEYLRGSFLGRAGRLINPAGVNPLQTPVSIGQALAGLATGDPTAPEGAQFFPPALGLGLGLATGRNTLGVPLKGNVVSNARQLLWDPTFAAQLARAGSRTAGAKVNTEGELQNAWLAALLGSRTQSKSFPDPNDPYWRFFLGGLYDRRYDEGALKRAKALEESGR